jgi:hypothetical protein
MANLDNYHPDNRPTEHQEQSYVIEWANMRSVTYPELALLFAIPNGTKAAYKRYKSGGKWKSFSPEGIKMKQEGLKPGVPDLFLPVSRFGWHGLFIEMKRVASKGKKGGEVREEQNWWKEKLIEQHYCSVICWGADDAINTISNYLEIPAQERL